jgi:hypothetical protein
VTKLGRTTSALRRPKSTLAQAVLPVVAGLVFFAVLGLAVWGIAAWMSRASGPSGKVESNLGDDTFNMGSAKDRAQEVAQRGPLLFPGLVSADQGYIVVNHKGTDSVGGWVAFAAVPPGQGVQCAVQWNGSAQQFQDPCTGTAFPADGTGLTHYKVIVNGDGDLVIDLGRGGTPTTTSSS